MNEKLTFDTNRVIFLSRTSIKAIWARVRTPANFRDRILGFTTIKNNLASKIKLVPRYFMWVVD